MSVLRRLLYLNLKLVFKLSSINRNRLTPAGMLVAGGMLASGIFGVDVRQSLAYHVFSVTAALLLVAVCGILLFRGNFRVTRQLPRYATVERPFRYYVEIENLGSSGQLDLLVFDELEQYVPAFEEFARSRDPEDRRRNRFDRLVGYPRLMSLVRKKRGGTIEPASADLIPSGRSTGVEFVLRPLRRGYIYFYMVRISRTDPLGLLRAMKNFASRDRLLVLPRTYTPPNVEFTGTRKYQQGGLNLASTVGDSQEFKSLRDYQPGDPLRAIHWRSYAKMGVPVVKEFQDEFFVRQGLLLDTFQDNQPERCFEEAVSVAASFCVSLPGQDSLLDLMFIAGRAYRITSGRGLARPENMLEMLACIEPARNSKFKQLKDLVLGHSRETSGIICVLLSWDLERQELVELLLRFDVPVLVYLVLENGGEQVDPGPLKADPKRLVVLGCDSIQEDLLSRSPRELDGQ